MTVDVVTEIRDWMDRGYPDPGEERRDWAQRAFDESIKNALALSAPLEEQDARNKARPKISGSSYKNCARALFYKNRRRKQRPVFADSRLIWQMGYVHEAIIVYQAIMCGLPIIGPGIHGEQYEGVVRDPDVGDVPFHPDIVIPVHARMGMTWDEINAHACESGVELYPIDVKSMNPFTYDDWKDGRRRKHGKGRDPKTAGPDNKFGYLSQVNVSMMAEGFTNFAGFVASNKMKGAMRQYEVEADPLLQAEIRAAWRASKGAEAPPRPAWATTWDRPQLKCAELADPRCGYCDFNTTACFPGFMEQSVGGRKVFRGPREDK